VTRRLALAAALVGAVAASVRAAPPPPPAAYFNDYAGVVPADAGARLDARLRAFEQETSNQVLVAVFSELPEDAGGVVEDFAVETARAWRVGQKARDNGVILFVFLKERKIRVEVGYGLEGAIPDARARQIGADVIGPRFRAGDFAGGLEAGVEAIMAASRGEFTALPRRRGSDGSALVLLGFLVLIFLFFAIAAHRSSRRYGHLRAPGRSYSRRGWENDSWSPPVIFGGSSRDSSWSGGGGFGGGGGSFGGGGATSDW
jgi:uncharacterized protein